MPRSPSLPSVLLATFLLAAFVSATTDQATPATDQTDVVLPELNEAAEPLPIARLQQGRGATLAEVEWAGFTARRRSPEEAAAARETPESVSELGSKDVAASRRRAPLDMHRGHYYSQSRGRWVPVGR
eukprot:TRINITY_DN372_c0_g1_i2.p2 TRINITY_DN372_c0_g1~~TRINITY_DN372_c0_g1_i2.p2  ORF type:complete len:128 (-),score=11.76 TRINITY_DN372_c0_g1_i2:185-568(-)